MPGGFPAQRPPPPAAPPPPLPPRRPPPPPPRRPPPPRQPPPVRSAPPRRPVPAARDRPAPPAPKPVAPQPRKTRKRRPWGRILLVLLLLAGSGVIGAGVWLDGALNRIPAITSYPDRPAAGRGTTWLLVGSDGRHDLTPEQQAELSTGGDLGSGRTDTLLLVHLPGLGSSAPTTMVSIPRDSYVPIPGYGSDKINAAYTFGGAPLLTQTVEQATGLRIDHYAEIGFAGFAVLVDALGGVTACPAEPISDPLAGIDLPAGCQQLDGRTALGFVRSRATPRADLDRMVNQRQFMSALLNRAASPAVWLNPWRWYAVPRAAADAVTVDTDDHVWDLARLGWALRGSPVTVTVPIGSYTSTGSGAVVTWDDAAAGALFEALATDAPIPQSVLEAQP
ncbi:LCP family protein [[Mycobacterium] burgundiense]|uniref:LCP family protein n=2 Tax=[Mycobacterium] burgundiense TaxID=3064286 RepID=A0ABM9L8H0_9MYCO|nr:LCP family protein [Mycolicibacterium sp. MU0053]CAJ1494614.1 LCP family protein [Mycolicibacterium sp. MU0053]